MFIEIVMFPDGRYSLRNAFTGVYLGKKNGERKSFKTIKKANKYRENMHKELNALLKSLSKI